jgi:hypothetical protein
MNAIIEVINNAKRMAGARIDAGELVVFELRDDSKPAVGDAISFRDFNAMGKRRYQNTTQKLEMRVSVRGIVGSLAKARELCLLKP